MFYVLSWCFVLALLSLWSLATWALHAAAAWTAANAGALSGAGLGTGTLALPDWLAPWIPPELAQWAAHGMAALAPLVDTLLQVVPALAAGVTVGVWVIWALGSLLLVLLGAGLHLLIALLRRRDGGSGPNAGPNAGSPLAAG